MGSIFKKWKEKHPSDQSSVEVVLTSTRPTQGKIVFEECCCCGTVLKHPEGVPKFKCSICFATVILKGSDLQVSDNERISVDTLKELATRCNNRFDTTEPSERSKLKHDIFCPIEEYLSQKFGNVHVLNKSFKSKTQHEFINYSKLANFYELVVSLPTKRPLYKMLVSCNELLKRPHIRLTQDPQQPKMGLASFRWVLIILEIPILRQCLYVNSKSRSSFDTPQLRAICYEILKRSIGYLSSIDLTVGKELVHYLKYMDNDRFIGQIQLINLYTTFHLTRILHKQNKNNLPTQPDFDNPSPNINDFGDSEKLNPRKIEQARVSSLVPQFMMPMVKPNGSLGVPLPKNFKFKVSDYGNDWHIRTGSKILLFYYVTNQSVKKCAMSQFYNTMLDFIDYKRDFDYWKNMNKMKLPGDKLTLTIFENTKNMLYDDRNGGSSVDRPSNFTMCQFPYLLSLGVKISIMEYESRRIMEYNAEQAFLRALDKRQAVDVYLKIRVRRDHVAQDSLRCIQNHQRDLKKSLRVEFINEPGIDAGGLRKEWFLLLTRDLFNPSNGLFVYVEESRFFWFGITRATDGELLQGHKNNSELYYLCGVVLGLAIYNSTILDLNFPRSLYKKLCGEKLTMNDFLELYPITGRNMLKMCEYDGEDFEDIFTLNHETSFQDCWGKVHRRELCSGGSNKAVNNQNKYEYTKLWMDFYMSKSIGASFESFHNGFKHVIESDSFKLFDSEEVEQLVCGSPDKAVDVRMLQSVAHYSSGWSEDSTIVKWFWEIFENYSYREQRKLLQFVTGSDRVPATGISTMQFKVTRLGNDSIKLPLAHTCFNELCLYEYSSMGKLHNKLSIAINESEGYGFR